MPRTKEFRPEEALDRAVELFWRRGYEATSMRDLLDAMCIGRGSFYDTFGDKHALFLAALDRFEEVRTSWIWETLDGAGLEGIEEVFRRTEGAFEGALVLARESGEIPSGSDPKSLARFLVGNLHGLRVLARAGAERATLEDTVRVALRALR